MIPRNYFYRMKIIISLRNRSICQIDGILRGTISFNLSEPGSNSNEVVGNAILHSLTLVRQPVKEKENSEFKLAKLSLKNYLVSRSGDSCEHEGYHFRNIRIDSLGTAISKKNLCLDNFLNSQKKHPSFQ